MAQIMMIQSSLDRQINGASMRQKAFTIIELIFVIIVLGILASVAIPKFSESIKQADITKAKSKVAAIRSGLQVYKNKHILVGDAPYPNTLDSDANHLFDKVLPYPTAPSNSSGGWTKCGKNQYCYHIGGGYLKFVYDAALGTFTCDSTKSTAQDASRLCQQF